MSTERESLCQDRLEKALEALEAARKMQHDWMTHGLDFVHLYIEDVDGDWLERWGDDEDALETVSAEPGVVNDSAVECVTAFLKSDDPVAVRVRERLVGQSPFEISAELEKCRSIPEDDDQQLRAIKKALANRVTTSESYRDSTNENVEAELLDLAEDLLEKLTEIWEKQD